MYGYSSSDEVALKYIAWTGRWIDKEKNTALWGGLAVQENIIEAKRAELAASAVTSIAGEWAYATTRSMNEKRAAISDTISRLGTVRAKVIALLHRFVSAVYYEQAFANIASTTFDAFQAAVDIKIGEASSAAMAKIPLVADRLSEGHPEAVSQALSSCRRILETFADAIYPPQGEDGLIDGSEIKLGKSHHQNRINQYIADRVASASRRVRLRQNLKNLFDRVSTGVHSDVDEQEALALFLNVYLFLGEVVGLKPSIVRQEPAL